MIVNRIGDFGLARAMSAGQTLTADASVLLGTVAYLAPEQVQRGIADKFIGVKWS
jgi:serine/threonine-protein kinase